LRKALITGGLGFIGHHLWRALVDRGWHVTVVDNLLSNPDLDTGTEQSLRMQRLMHNKMSGWQQMDAAKLRGNLHDIPHPEVIYHLAGHANQRAVMKDAMAALENMVHLTGLVANYADSVNARMIYISSSQVYGRARHLPVPEDHELDPTNLYGLFKMQGEQLVKAMVKDHVIVRPTAVYGPRDDGQRVISKWIEAAQRGQNVNVMGGAMIDPTHVDDLVEGLILAARADTQRRDIVNLSRGAGVSLVDIAYLISDLNDHQHRTLRFADPDMDSAAHMVLDIRRARDMLGFAPKIDWRTGIEQLWHETKTLG
jgi:UDP-glucose 4-epimerase